VLYNDDWHAFEDVVAQVQKATDCSTSEAWMITYRAHATGRSVVYAGSKPECRRVLGVLREIRLQAELDDA
jgi:ATP-dependent Clp protease adapter protein ClpS